MGRIRRANDDKENAVESSRISRPWDNFTADHTGKLASPNGLRQKSERFASLRVEHFVESGIASRAAMFEGYRDDSAPICVTELASKFDNQADVFRKSSRAALSRGGLDNPLQERQPENGTISSICDPLLARAPFESDPSITRDNIFESRVSDDDSLEEDYARGQLDPSPIRTQLGRRSVKPLVMSPNPPPLVGLPIPSKSRKSASPAAHKDLAPLGDVTPDGMESVPSSTVAPAVTLSPAKRCSVRAPPMDLSARRASRRSMRVPSASPSGPSASRQSSARSARVSTRHSMRLSTRVPQDLNEIPQSSFLGFDDDDRLSDMGAHGAPTSVVDENANEPVQTLDFSDPDTFDTFGSLQDEHDERSLTEFRTPEKNVGALPGLSASSSDKPVFPNMSFTKPRMSDRPQASFRREEEDDDDQILDVPLDMLQGSQGNRALRDLQRASVTAGNELAAQVQELAEESRAIAKDRISRAQGELELRSRFFRRWNARYASIVDHAFFGAVLFLFRADTNASKPKGTIALKNSKMIVLSDSIVREIEGSRRNGPNHLFELKTRQRKYVFAAVNAECRNYWMDNLTSFATTK